MVRAGQHALTVLDPDGSEPRDAALDRARHLAIRDRADGSVALRGTLTPDVGAALHTVLSPRGRRNSANARPTISSLLPAEYTFAVSKKLIPTSSAY